MPTLPSDTGLKKCDTIAKVHRAKLVGLAPGAATNVVIKILHPSVRDRLLLDTQVVFFYCTILRAKISC
jgi:predicted unusual protein kinase regulating ubiquinone biosynthesis (AarF/ABC1/UbiB family)